MLTPSYESASQEDIDHNDRKPREKSASGGSTESSSSRRKIENSSQEDSMSQNQDQFSILDEQTIQEKAFIAEAAKFSHYPELRDDFKSEKAYVKHGGFALRDKELLGRLRSSGTEVVKMVGKKIFSGKFNLT
jgi:hypothetical protein